MSGGRADGGADQGDVRAAAGRLFASMQARLPRATVVVIGPMWIGGVEPPRRLREVRDPVRDGAAVTRLPFADPIADRWIVRTDADGITPAGRHMESPESGQ